MTSLYYCYSCVTCCFLHRLVYASLPPPVGGLRYLSFVTQEPKIRMLEADKSASRGQVINRKHHNGFKMCNKTITERAESYFEGILILLIWWDQLVQLYGFSSDTESPDQPTWLLVFPNPAGNCCDSTRRTGLLQSGSGLFQTWSLLFQIGSTTFDIPFVAGAKWSSGHPGINNMNFRSSFILNEAPEPLKSGSGSGPHMLVWDHWQTLNLSTDHM